MKRVGSILSIFLIGALILSGCGEASNRTADKNTEQSTNGATQSLPPSSSPKTERLIDPADKVTTDIKAADFKKGVNIDFQKYKESFFNDDIIQKMSNNLQAVVDQNKDKFHENLNRDSIGEAFFFGNKDDQFMFTDLDLLEKLSDPEQIRVGVYFARKSSEGNITNEGITYFFTKNKAGEWTIETID